MQKSKDEDELYQLFRQPEVTSWRALVMTYRMIFSLLETAMQKHNCSVSRLQVLLAMYFEGPQVPIRLADRLMVTRGNISTLLKRMQAEGLIVPSNERGSKSRPAFTLSEKGRKLFRELYPIHALNIKKLMPVLEAPVVEKFVAAQAKIHREYKVGVPMKAAKAKA